VYSHTCALIHANVDTDLQPDGGHNKEDLKKDVYFYVYIFTNVYIFVYAYMRIDLSICTYLQPDGGHNE